MDFTGTGNSVDPTNPAVLRLIMDSLRYWVIECHIDGFRFDLASTLARECFDFDLRSGFFDVINQDPALSQVKLIAEPWDVEPGGLSGRQLPASLVGVEREVPRRRAGLLAWPLRGGGVRLALDRVERPLPGGRTQSVRLGEPRHRPRRVHACAISSATTRSTTRPTARRTRTAAMTTAPGTAAWRGHGRSRDARAARAPAAQLHGHPAALPGRADAARPATSSAASQAGNNNAWCQDNEISWLEWEHERSPARVARSSRAARLELRPSHPVLPALAFLHRRSAQRGHCRTCGGFAPTAGG